MKKKQKQLRGCCLGFFFNRGSILPVYMGILYNMYIYICIHMILVKGENKLILKRRLSYWILLLGDGFNVF